MNQPRTSLPDHASDLDARGIAIDAVGIKRLRIPITVSGPGSPPQPTVAELEMAVGLPGDARGTHMSRFIEVLNAHRANVHHGSLLEMISTLGRRLETRAGYIQMSFPYFMEKAAPVSGARSLMEYRCGFTARLVDGQGQVDTVIQIPVKSLCPCSKAISDYGAHNQRSEITVRLRSDRAVSFAAVIEAVEGCASSPIFALLKREDEKWVTEQAYDNPRFVEDLVREVMLALQALPEISAAEISAENFESIHNHSAFATVSWARAEAPAPSPAASAPCEAAPAFCFGAWLKDLRSALGISQADLARQVGCSTSFLCKVEHGAKVPGPELLLGLATALGQDPVKLSLRAGVVPPALLAQIQANPEALLTSL